MTGLLSSRAKRGPFGSFRRAGDGDREGSLVAALLGMTGLLSSRAKRGIPFGSVWRAEDGDREGSLVAALLGMTGLLSSRAKRGIPFRSVGKVDDGGPRGIPRRCAPRDDKRKRRGGREDLSCQRDGPLLPVIPSEARDPSRPWILQTEPRGIPRRCAPRDDRSFVIPSGARDPSRVFQESRGWGPRGIPRRCAPRDDRSFVIPSGARISFRSVGRAEDGGREGSLVAALLGM